MGLVQVVIDDSTDKVIEGQYTFDRSGGGVLVVPASASFPGSPVAGELLWRTDESRLYRRNAANTAWDAVQSAVALHATTHQNGGSDELSVAGLSGVLADAQVPQAHAASHQNGGGDELSVAGLSGVLADAQTPQAHAIDGAAHTGQLAHSALSGITATDHHTNVNDPTAGEKAALAGTTGTPGSGNKYVTDTDTRNTNARTPTVHASTHASAGSDPVTLAQSQVTDLVSDLAAKASDAAVVHLAGTETITGGKTFSLSPTVPTPTASGHAVTKSYVDALSGGWAPGVQTIAALRAVASADRADKQIRLVEDAGAIYRFDTAGLGSDDGDLIVVPSDITPPAPGRWFKAQAATQNHESLSGLQGGGVGDHQHLTTTQVGYLPSSGEKDALVGTSGTPSTSNKYVTNADARNSDARTPTAHAASHVPGGSDALATATAVAVGTANAAGTAASFSRSDHVHLGLTVGGNRSDANLNTLTGGGNADALHSHALSVFGSQYQYAAAEGTSTTTGTTLVSKVLLTTPSIPAGDYHVAWGMELSVDAANRDIEVVLRADGVEVALHSERLTVAAYFTGHGAIYRPTWTAGVHTLELLFRRPGGSSATITSRRARIELWRVS